MFKDRVVKPLIVATEKVVEYYMTENQADQSQTITQKEVIESKNE